jgi:hypothetical protein
MVRDGSLDVYKRWAEDTGGGELAMPGGLGGRAG